MIVRKLENSAMTLKPNQVSIFKICILEVYILVYIFKATSCIYKHHHKYHRQTIFNQLNNMVPYIDIIGLWEMYVMRHKCHERWLHFHFKVMLITALGRYTLIYYLNQFIIFIAQIKKFLDPGIRKP